ncbi:MAG: hypothetical protein HY021_03850 [Burkholderiales bacterium]|nr:hypothetical protein [Burkholderiales bacterium]
MSKAKKSTKSAPVRLMMAASGPPDEDAAAQLRDLKLNLQATREKLMLVRPDLLDDADHEAWSNQIFQVSLAINGLRNAALETLSAAFKQALPSFASATTTLTDELFKLQQATDVIKAVAGALGVISKIATLLA